MSQDRDRLGRYLEARLGELNLTQEGLAAAADVDPKTVYGLIKGHRWPRPSTRAKIERALGYKPGSLTLIRDGQEPALVTPSMPFPPAEADLTVDEILAIVARMSDSDVREAVIGVVEEEERRLAQRKQRLLDEREQQGEVG